MSDLTYGLFPDLIWAFQEKYAESIRHELEKLLARRYIATSNENEVPSLRAEQKRVDNQANGYDDGPARNPADHP